MKKLTLFAAIFMLVQSAIAGGLVTNANQSAQYVRMLSRNASLQIDAVYYNPAGLFKLEDGLHFSISNQTIFQDKNVNSMFPLLNDGEYVGKVKAPLFPNVYAVYKKDKLALSFGFQPIGGGGSADFDRGLPSFEIPLTKLTPALSGLTEINPDWDVTGYDVSLSFKGSSVYFGFQLGASYEINDMFSVYGGVRYTPAVNTYEGSINDISVLVGGQSILASTFLNNVSGGILQSIIPTIDAGLSQLYAGISQLNAGVTTLNGTATSLQPLIDGGAGSYTLAQLEGANYIDAATRAQIEGGLSSIGLTSEQIAAMNLATIQGSFTTAAAGYQAQADAYSTQAAEYEAKKVILNGTAAGLSAQADELGDKEVKTTQRATGWTPIIGVNISPMENLNIGLKYEMKTALNFENDTEVDDLGLFPDGQKQRNDIPALLTVGIGYQPADWLETQLSFNTYFDKGVDWGKNVRDIAIWEDVDATQIRTRGIDQNYWELGLGLQFNLSDNFAISVGGLRSQSGIADSYQSDFSYSNSSTSVAGGIQWKINDRLTFDAGLLNTFYEDAELTFQDPDIGSYKETLGKTTIDFAFGVSYSIF